MKILLLRQYNPYVETGASANRFRGLVDGLVALGHQITLLIIGGIIEKEELYVPINQNIQIIYLSRKNHYNYLINRLNLYIFDDLCLLLIRIKFRKFLQKKYDIIWLTKNSTVLKLFLKEYKNCNSKIFIELNEYNDIYKFDIGKSNFLQKIMSVKENHVFVEAINKIDLFAVMTKALYNHYQRFANYNSKFIILPLTVDMSRFRSISKINVSYQKPYIAYIGSLSNQKDGIDILIKAFSKLIKKHLNLHLNIAGFYHYDVPMQKELIDELNLGDKVHYLGVLSREKIPEFITNACLLVMARPNSHQAEGGFPTKLGEYLATGNPVCVTSVGEISEYLQDNESAFIAIPGNVDSFAEAMERALNNPMNAMRVGKNGKRVAEKNFSIEVQSKRLSDFLEMSI